MIINHNISAINAQRMFKLNTIELSDSIAKLSSGMRINKAADDPAGLAVSEKMRAQVRGLNMASRNIQNGISFIQTAEGWLSETTDILQRMRELAVQSANGIYTPEDRMQIHTEIKQLVSEVDRIASQAEFNGYKLLKGGFRTATAGNPGAEASKGDASSGTRDIPKVQAGDLGHQHKLVDEKNGGITIHVGPNMDHRERIFIENMSAPALGLTEGPGSDAKLKVDYTTQDGANQAISTVDTALYVVNKQRANLGAYQSRMEIASRGVDIAAENLQSAESQIRDTNMALEMVQYVKSKILTETSASLLSQANTKPYVVAGLLNSLK